LRQLPRPYRRNAVDVSGAVPAHGMVPRLPPPAGAAPAAPGGSLQHALGAAARPARPRSRAGEEIQGPRRRLPYLLHRVPPMNSRKALAHQLAALQDRLGSVQGKLYWRTLEELADSEAFQELMRREFPEQASVWPTSLSRRRFLTLMSASLALAGLG